MRIPDPEGNATVGRVRREILDQLPQNPLPTTVDILRCLEKSIQEGFCIADTERFVRERWVSEHTDIIRRKVARAYHSGLLTFDMAGSP
ncbi:uncharacterized protein BDV17DRAFT_255527 [Aspergillus undulatus]|uniref:uncharacterized protein n=1 Tax=Aspergillus undulatus TaxID=1810928 RepID=UPI003CCD9730